jgi:hypothetical protein
MMTAPPYRSPRADHGQDSMLQAVETRMFLIAGADMAVMEETAMSLFRAGHVPVYQLPQPLSERLLDRCDAIIRVGGISVSADAIVTAARARGLRVFFSLQDALDG